MRQPSINSTGEISGAKILSVYVLAYLYWFASTFLAGILIYALRAAVMALTVLLWLPAGGKPSASDLFYINLQMGALDSSLFILYGAGMILATVIFESLFRHHAFDEDVKQIFFKAIVLESALITFFALLATLFEIVLNGFTWRMLSEPILSVLWTVFVTWQWQAFHRGPNLD